jgi:hypothetical protein
LIPFPNKSYNGVGSGIIFFELLIPNFKRKKSSISFHSFPKVFSTPFIKQKRPIISHLFLLLFFFSSSSSFLLSLKIKEKNTNPIDYFYCHPIHKLHRVLHNKKKQHKTKCINILFVCLFDG